MGVYVRSPGFSFVQFSTFGYSYGFTEEDHSTCFPEEVGFCLPVYAYDDIAFQFIVLTDTVAEADELCTLGTTKVKVGLVRACSDAAFLIDFDADGFTPERFRISEKEVLYNWAHGFPGFDIELVEDDCFYVQVKVLMDSGTVHGCSNCFQRVLADCYTSILEYGAEQNIFGFNYCGSGALFEDEEVTCEPTIVQFTDALTISYPYSETMRELYGDVPTVEIWIFEPLENKYFKANIQAGFDAYPPTLIQADLGGPATGFMKIS